jgi:hypothetical protein
VSGGKNDGEQSTQAAFGKVMFEIAARKDEFAGRVVTTSPDVTVSTNLGGFVNRRGVFQRRAHDDVFKRRRIPSAQVWSKAETGQHVELGIAENNLFIALAALGLTAPLFGERLFPVGTLYDPFIARGLDALNYACYQDARFLLVATPSGLTLAPEGGAHQSINAPVIGMAQPGLDTYEPAYADETAVLMAHAFERIQAKDGCSTYLRLSTRVIAQPERTDDAWRQGVVEGAYWLKAPAPGASSPWSIAAPWLPRPWRRSKPGRGHARGRPAGRHLGRRAAPRLDRLGPLALDRGGRRRPRRSRPFWDRWTATRASSRSPTARRWPCPGWARCADSGCEPWVWRRSASRATCRTCTASTAWTPRRCWTPARTCLPRGPPERSFARSGRRGSRRPAWRGCRTTGCP